MKRGFKSQAETRAKEARAMVGVPVYSNLPARKLALALGIPVFGPAEIPGIPEEVVSRLVERFRNNWSAVTIPFDGTALIVYNPSHLPERQESYLMHEIAHILCKHRPARVEPAGAPPWASRSYDPEQEEEAEWQGACLQIPRDGLLALISRGCDNAAIAAHFGASEQMVRFRRNTTGVDQQVSRRASFRRSPMRS